MRKSKQREALLSELSCRTDHPTAEELYVSLKSTIPNLSLGTVYRNLSMLSENNEIIKLSTDGADHFDYNTEQHYHLQCNACKRLYDLNIPIYPELDRLAQANYDGKIGFHRLIFYGICEKCNNKIN